MAGWPWRGSAGSCSIPRLRASIPFVDRSHLLEPEHITGVHDLHVRTVTSNLPALSAHVVVNDGCFTDGHAPQLLDEIQACLVGHFDVEHSTFQLEPASHSQHEPGTH